MKKLILMSTFTCLLGMAAAPKVSAQAQGAASISPIMVVNTKAMRNFVKAYETAVDPEWVLLKEGYVCRFMIDGVRCRAFYSQKGAWLLTVASYEENKLPKDVRAMVRSTYYDYTISYIDEISAPGKSKSYLVQIQDEKGMKILQVSDGGIETVKELVKLAAH